MTVCNHVRRFSRCQFMQERDYLRNEQERKENIKQFNRNILAPELENITVNCPVKQKKIAHIITKSKPEKVVKRKELELKQANIYRLKGKNNTKKHNLFYENEALKFKSWRKSSYFAVQKYCYANGFRFDKGLFEDSFQEALIHHMTYKQAGVMWCKQKGLPITAILNKYSKQKYIEQANWLNNDSIDTITDEVIAGTNTAPTEAFYNLRQYDNYHENISFYETINEVLTAKQISIVKLILKGYTNKEETNPQYTAIAKQIGVSKQAVYKHTDRIKAMLSAGVLHS